MDYTNCGMIWHSSDTRDIHRTSIDKLVDALNADIWLDSTQTVSFELYRFLFLGLFLISWFCAVGQHSSFGRIVSTLQITYLLIPETKGSKKAY